MTYQILKAALDLIVVVAVLTAFLALATMGAAVTLPGEFQ